MSTEDDPLLKTSPDGEGGGIVYKENDSPTDFEGISAAGGANVWIDCALEVEGDCL
ncbi:MAG: hypothetical protein QF704_12855 [Anaerolineales bacterium]|nr:hypothetical protein [Anaerolineales bacterium]